MFKNQNLYTNQMPDMKETKEERMGRYIAIQLGALKFKKDPLKLYEYICKHREYFPNIKEVWLNDLENKYKKE